MLQKKKNVKFNNIDKVRSLTRCIHFKMKIINLRKYFFEMKKPKAKIGIPFAEYE